MNQLHPLHVCMYKFLFFFHILIYFYKTFFALFKMVPWAVTDPLYEDYRARFCFGCLISPLPSKAAKHASLAATTRNGISESRSDVILVVSGFICHRGDWGTDVSPSPLCEVILAIYHCPGLPT